LLLVDLLGFRNLWQFEKLDCSILVDLDGVVYLIEYPLVDARSASGEARHLGLSNHLSRTVVERDQPIERILCRLGHDFERSEFDASVTPAFAALPASRAPKLTLV
jgi:hypothetical protein